MTDVSARVGFITVNTNPPLQSCDTLVVSDGLLRPILMLRVPSGNSAIVIEIPVCYFFRSLVTVGYLCPHHIGATVTCRKRRRSTQGVSRSRLRPKKPFFPLMNTTRTHVFTRVRPEYAGKSGMPGNEYGDGM
jgi:hypothetical protein